MPKEAMELHLVEKGIHQANLYRKPQTKDQWVTGIWWISDKTAKELIGKRIYLHSGQGAPSHIGGEIISFFHKAGTDVKRKVFVFKELEKCKGVTTPTIGWGNEKKIIWKP